MCTNRRSHIPMRWFGAAPMIALLVAAPAQAQNEPARVAAEQVAVGDQHYAAGNLPAARASYAAAVQAEPQSLTGLCRLARVESEMGEDTSGEEQRRLISAAVEHARAAVKAAPDSAQGHVWLAATLGRQALREGPKTRLALSREIKSEVERAIAIDPNIGRAYHVRAMWNRKIASLNAMERLAANAVLGGVPKGASMDNAVRDFQKAIELEPGYIHHRLELGRTYTMMNRNAEARRELQAAVSLPPTSSPQDRKYQAEAAQLLTKLRK